jgi:GNAT superfamily N-acetyltransferase
MKQKLLRSWRIAQSQFKDHTLQEFISILIKSLFRVERILIYVKDLNEGITHSPNNTIYNSITKGELNDLECVRGNMISPYWEFCCDLYDGVKYFFIFKDNGEIGHVSWIYFKGDPNRLIDLTPKECEIKFCLTLPQYRGKGIYPATIIRIQDYLREKGYRRVFICVRKDNIPSIRGIEKAGFSLISEMKLIKLMGMQVSKKYSTGH